MEKVLLISIIGLSTGTGVYEGEQTMAMCCEYCILLMFGGKFSLGNFRASSTWNYNYHTNS